jgi:hypothetical protein
MSVMCAWGVSWRVSWRGSLGLTIVDRVRREVLFRLEQVNWGQRRFIGLIPLPPIHGGCFGRCCAGLRVGM